MNKLIIEGRILSISQLRPVYGFILENDTKDSTVIVRVVLNNEVLAANSIHFCVEDLVHVEGSICVQNGELVLFAKQVDLLVDHSPENGKHEILSNK